MKEINAIVARYREVDFTAARAALATVVRVEGSSYRRTGARMLVLDDGSYTGGISGGCLEGDALRRAQKAIALGTPSIITYDTTQDDSHQVGVGLGCNGIIDVLFTPLDPNDTNNPVQQLATLTHIRTPRVVLTITGAAAGSLLLGRSFLYAGAATLAAQFPVQSVVPILVADIAETLAQCTSRSVSYATDGGEIQVFIEVMVPAVQLVIYGGNYDVYPLVRIAAELGWHTTVVMNTAKADKALWAIAGKLVHHTNEPSPAIDQHTAVVLMAHDYNTDFANFRYALQTAASYIGLLGPRKRTQKMLDALAQEGRMLSTADEQRMFSPAGLDIGALTPEEIALSITAEIRAHFAGRQGMPLRERRGTIHGA